MAKCWTCGTEVGSPAYTCDSCESSSALAALRRRAAENTESDVAGELERLQEEGAHELRDAMRSLSRVSSVMPEWRSVMTRMLEDRGVTGLATAIRWGFGELTWRAHQASDVLTDIDHSLRTPSATQADEWRRMAEELRRRGVLDESEEFYLKALELNRLDYRLYVGLAETYIRDSRFDQAKEMLERSLAHAPRDDIDYRSHSYRLLGHIHECEGELDRACEVLSEAVEMSPGYVEARYDFAQYAAQASLADEALASLREVLLARPSYWYLANVEPNFDPLRADVDDLLDDLRVEARSAASESVARAEEAIREAGTEVEAARREAEELGIELESAVRYEQAVAEAERSLTDMQSEDYLTVLGAADSAREALELATGVGTAAMAEVRDLAEARACEAVAEEIAADSGLAASSSTQRAATAVASADEDQGAVMEPEFVASVAAAPSSAEPAQGQVMSPHPVAHAPATPKPAVASARVTDPRTVSALVSGLRAAAVITPIAAFVCAVIGFMHGSMVMSIENLDAPFVYLWEYVSYGTGVAAVVTFGYGVLRGRGRSDMRAGV